MALLGNSFDDPQSAAIMALAGNMVRGDFGGGLLGANQAYQAMKEGALNEQMKRAQISNFNSEVEQRAAAIKKQQALMEMGQRLTGATAPALPGQLGSGMYGIVPPPPGQPDIAPRRAGIENASINDIAGYHIAGGPDLLPTYKFAREGIERKPGSFYEDMQGRRQYVVDPKSGMDYQNGRISQIPGYSDFLSSTTLASEGVKALLGSAGRVNLRGNADGTSSPVSELDENPTLQRLLSNGGGRSNLGAPTGASQPAAPLPTGQRPVIDPAAQKSADAESISMIESELQNPKLPADQRAGLQRELQRLTVSQSQPGFPTPSLVTTPKPGVMPAAKPGIGYGKTTAQTITDKAAEETAVQQAKADVVPTQQKQAALANAEYLTSVVDMALKHPGLSAATGWRGTLDPSNYLPGTDAKNFHVVLDQIKGAAFMQAYQNLKGGGQITEVEGKKATDAIARLNSAQSTPEFIKALNDFKSVIDAGKARLQGGNTGGATGSFEPTGQRSVMSSGGWSATRKN